MNEKEWIKLLKGLRTEKDKNNKLLAIKILLEHDYLNLREKDRLFNYICELTGLNVNRANLARNDEKAKMAMENLILRKYQKVPEQNQSESEPEERR